MTGPCCQGIQLNRIVVLAATAYIHALYDPVQSDPPQQPPHTTTVVLSCMCSYGNNNSTGLVLVVLVVVPRSFYPTPPPPLFSSASRIPPLFLSSIIFLSFLPSSSYEAIVCKTNGTRQTAILLLLLLLCLFLFCACLMFVPLLRYAADADTATDVTTAATP